jgi:hypothetical protein
MNEGDVEMENSRTFNLLDAIPDPALAAKIIELADKNGVDLTDPRNIIQPGEDMPLPIGPVIKIDWRSHGES